MAVRSFVATGNTYFGDDYPQVKIVDDKGGSNWPILVKLTETVNLFMVADDAEQLRDELSTALDTLVTMVSDDNDE